MRIVPLIALIPLGAAAAAQTPVVLSHISPGITTGTVLLQANDVTGCPVGFAARHTQDGGLVDASPAPRHPEQGYRITFSPGASPSITGARITLHGLSGPHVLPAAGQPRKGSDASESFNLSPASGAKHLFHSTIYTERLTGVQWVELNELTYADGTHWHESSSDTCRVAPNGFMLVAGAR